MENGYDNFLLHYSSFKVYLLFDGILYSIIRKL